MTSLRSLPLLAAFVLAISPARAEPVQLTVAEAILESDRQSGAPVIEIRLDEAGREAFHAFSKDNVLRIVDVHIGEEIVMSPRIMAPIETGRILLADPFERVDAHRIAELLQSGEAVITIVARE
jgi:preprotein translocase subunit SecD